MHVARGMAVAGMAMSMLLAGGVGCAAGGGSPAAARGLSDADLARTESARLVVHGLSCPLCATNVDEVLKEIDGVTAVAMDLGSGEATLTMKSGHAVTRAKLTAAVKKAGFTLVEIKLPKGG
jgi:copper chaperone CopZ